MGYGSSGKGEPFRRAVGEELVTCHKGIAELLIAEVADVNAKDKLLGWTPLDKAIYGNHCEIADLLRKHGGKTGKELKAEEK